MPARLTGQQYIAVHGQNITTNSDYIIIVATENTTSLTIIGPATTTGIPASLTTMALNAGGMYTYDLPMAINRVFTVNASWSVYTFPVSAYAINESGMGILPTINPCTGSQRIDFYRAGTSNQAIVTIPSAGTATLTFRGNPSLPTLRHRRRPGNHLRYALHHHQFPNGKHSSHGHGKHRHVDGPLSRGRYQQ